MASAPEPSGSAGSGSRGFCPPAAAAMLQHAGELPGIEMTLVEQLLCRLDDGRDDSRLADDTPGRADRATPSLARDVSDREGELRRTCKGVAPSSIGVDPACAACPVQRMR